MAIGSYDVHPIGWVESSLTDPHTAPKQGDEGAPDAWLVFDPRAREGIRDLVLVVHPRGDPTRPETGVFSTRSPDRPNPIGLHRVTIKAVDGLRLLVGGLEAVDATPILDVKPVLGGVSER